MRSSEDFFQNNFVNLTLFWSFLIEKFKFTLDARSLSWHFREKLGIGLFLRIKIRIPDSW
jgi:hypothetical protein